MSSRKRLRFVLSPPTISRCWRCGFTSRPSGPTLARVSLTLPEQPPFALRARLLTSRDDGSTVWEPDGLIDIDAGDRIAFVGPGSAYSPTRREGPSVIDLRPLVVMPGLIDTHVHIPQVPAAGLGAGQPDTGGCTGPSGRAPCRLVAGAPGTGACDDRLSFHRAPANEPCRLLRPPLLPHFL